MKEYQGGLKPNDVETVFQVLADLVWYKLLYNSYPEEIRGSSTDRKPRSGETLFRGKDSIPPEHKMPCQQDNPRDNYGMVYEVETLFVPPERVHEHRQVWSHESHCWTRSLILLLYLQHYFQPCITKLSPLNPWILFFHQWYFPSAVWGPIWILVLFSFGRLFVGRFLDITRCKGHCKSVRAFVMDIYSRKKLFGIRFISRFELQTAKIRCMRQRLFAYC